MKKANFIKEPNYICSHAADRDLIGPGLIEIKSSEILMVISSGRRPGDFGSFDGDKIMPDVFRSEDGGNSWQPGRHLNMNWGVNGLPLGGGVSMCRLDNNSLGMLVHRHVEGFHGGGIPVFSVSSDNGYTWKDGRIICEKEQIMYLMNDRLVRLKNGRLLAPVAVSAASSAPYIEGDACESTCIFSDDNGATWQIASGRTRLAEDLRGMAEPSVAELNDGSLLMLARTGQGCLCESRSYDYGENWTNPRKTNLVSPCAPLTLKSVSDGRLIVLYNHAEPLKEAAFFPRNPLCYAISSDNGATWSEPLCIDDSYSIRDSEHCQHVYPAAWITDKKMLVVYSTHPAPVDGDFNSRKSTVSGGVKYAIIGI
jgi:hypothetical protein